jgi:hypothetical protein
MRSLKRFWQSILAKRKIRALNCLSPKGEFSKPLERALDGSKTGLDKAKRGLDHIPVLQSVKVLQNLLQIILDPNRLLHIESEAL